MFKIIILPNKKLYPFGLFLKISNPNNHNLYKILLENFVNIDDNCGGFGKCFSCSITLNEGILDFFSFDFENILSCQTFNVFFNIIIKINN